jgi:hypothetical protein
MTGASGVLGSEIALAVAGQGYTVFFNLENWSHQIPICISRVECTQKSSNSFFFLQTNQNQNSDSKSSILLAVLLTLLVAFMLAVVGYFIIFKSRLVPRIRARFENTPYTDFEPSRHENQHVNELAESQARQSLPESAASFSKAACNQNISLVVTNETASASIGPGT